MSTATTPAEVIIDYLVTKGILTWKEDDGEWPTTYGIMPDEGDKAVGIFNTAGRMQDRLHRSGKTSERPGIQIRARALDETTSTGKLGEIKDVLDELYRERVITRRLGEEFLIHCVQRASNLLPVGYDPVKNRPNHTINFLITFGKIETPVEYLTVDGSLFLLPDGTLMETPT